MLKLIYGEGADVMTSGQWVTSARLPAAGFDFKHPALDTALKAIVDRVEPLCPFSAVSSPGH
jgi:NAD dependent epimerase/dehydratase family enzyme